jgi:hypothetical protein
MTYPEYLVGCAIRNAEFQFGVTSAFKVKIATPEQQLAWIAKDLAKLVAELAMLEKQFNEQDKVGDPFADSPKVINNDYTNKN